MQNEIRPLTALRYVAALWVFIFHIDMRWALPLPSFFKSIVAQGAVGMTLFFILSGYVLGFSYGSGVNDLRTYAIRRFARIYPIYVLAAVSTLPFFAVARSGWAGFAEGTFVVIANVFMIQAWFPQLMNYWNVGASWSLSAEAFFYAVFPMTIKLVIRASTRQISILFALAYAFSIIPGLSYWLIPGSAPIFYAMPIFRLPEFVVGVSCAVLAARGAIKLAFPRVTCLCAAGGLAILLGVGPSSEIYVTMNAVAVPCIAAIITSAAQMRSAALEHPISVALGKASYAFYSLQPLVIMTMIALQHGRAPWPPLPTLILSLIGLTTLALVAFIWVEEPLRRWLTRRSSTDLTRDNLAAPASPHPQM